MSWETVSPQYRELAETVLTPRQLQVLKLRLNGNSWRTIALALGIHEATARGHHDAALDRLRKEHAA